MTLGTLLFSAGAGLLVATVITAMVFFLHKPRYTPEVPLHWDREDQPLPGNAYPTERQTKVARVGEPLSIDREPVSPTIPNNTHAPD